MLSTNFSPLLLRVSPLKIPEYLIFDENCHFLSQLSSKIWPSLEAETIHTIAPPVVYNLIKKVTWDL